MSYISDSFDDEIVSLLKRGKVGLLPTDTIYGFSAKALDETAVERIHKLKSRDSRKPLIVLISDLKMLDLLSISAGQAKIAQKYWPGPLSVVLPSLAPDFLTRATGSLAVRMPDYPALLKLINEVGPIVSTSANSQGQEPVKNVADARGLFDDELDFFVDAGELDNPPSTLATVRGGKLRVVRPGAVKID